MVDNLLIMKCTIQTRDPSENSFGEPVYSWIDTYTNIPCRFSSQKGNMQRLESGENVKEEIKLFLKATQDVSENCRIVVLEETYEVLKVNKRYNSNIAHHTECDLRKVV